MTVKTYFLLGFIMTEFFAMYFFGLPIMSFECDYIDHSTVILCEQMKKASLAMVFGIPALIFVIVYFCFTKRTNSYQYSIKSSQVNGDR